MTDQIVHDETLGSPAMVLVADILNENNFAFLLWGMGRFSVDLYLSLYGAMRDYLYYWLNSRVSEAIDKSLKGIFVD